MDTAFNKYGLSLVIIYEPTGSSGGIEFLEYKWKGEEEQNYYGVHERTVKYMTKYDSFYYKLSYFVSKEYLDKHNEIKNEKLDNLFSISKLSHPDRLKMI